MIKTKDREPSWSREADVWMSHFVKSQELELEAGAFFYYVDAKLR